VALDSDEERVRASAVDALQQGLEQRDVDAIETWLVPDLLLEVSVPGLPRGKPLVAGLPASVSERSSGSAESNETTITLGADGSAAVRLRGDRFRRDPRRGRALPLRRPRRDSASSRRPLPLERIERVESGGLR